VKRKIFSSKATPRPRLRRILLLITLALILTAASVPPETAFDLRLSPLITGQRFDWIGWEAGVLLEETDWWVRGRPVSGDEASQKAEVLAFLDRERQVAELEDRLRGEVAQLPGFRLASPAGRPADLPLSVVSLQRQLDELRRQQGAAAPRVERILAAQVSQVLAAEGLGHGDLVWLPVTFRFIDPPTYLVISPRAEIRQYRGIYLLPDAPDAERASLEAAIEAQLNVSALVDDVGGIGSWPTMVINTTSLRSLLDIVAHEWTHTYLFLRPLGMHYSDSRDLTTINETVASIVGGEIADLAIARYYPELAPPPAKAAEIPSAAGNSDREDFNQAMRRIRLHVDELLATGRVSEAETYMEAERQKLVAKGYYLRRLNQAYFAFHGSYATSPTSVDPIGPWLRRLRVRSGSLKAFVDRAAGMRSLDDLLRTLGESRP
jgi:hypothetical protein